MRLWAEINLDNIAHNISNIKKSLNNNTKLLIVIKADAYGHGYKEIARTALENGADFFGVALADEAMQLRQNGFSTPILILGPVDDDEFEDAVKNDISLTVFDRGIAEKISQSAKKVGKKAKIHIKIDTGMSRVGYVTTDDSNDSYETIVNEICAISELENIELEGIFTHFAKSDIPEDDFTHMQFKRFITICDMAEKAGVNISIRHCANSGCIVNFPQYHLDMVRSGIITYGCAPSDESNVKSLDLKPAMQLKSKVTDIKKIGAGIGVSYGCTYETETLTDIATFGIGYADGYFRNLSNKAKVIIGGNIANVVGRVCMDQTMADVTGVKNIKIGDEVILFGTDGNNTITVDSVAKWAGTINYEVLSVVGKRVPRVYIKGGKIVKVLNYLV